MYRNRYSKCNNMQVVRIVEKQNIRKAEQEPEEEEEKK